MKKINLTKQCPDLVSSLRALFLIMDLEERARIRKMSDDVKDEIWYWKWEVGSYIREEIEKKFNIQEDASYNLYREKNGNFYIS